MWMASPRTNNLHTGDDENEHLLQPKPIPANRNHSSELGRNTRSTTFLHLGVLHPSPCSESRCSLGNPLRHGSIECSLYNHELIRRQPTIKRAFLRWATNMGSQSANPHINVHWRCCRSCGNLLPLRSCRLDSSELNNYLTKLGGRLRATPLFLISNRNHIDPRLIRCVRE